MCRHSERDSRDDRKHNSGRPSERAGQTPVLFFKGSGTLKPFVPSKEQQELKVPSTAQSAVGNKDSLNESGMYQNKDDFAFLKAENQADLQEWEATQQELDRQWYDNDEEAQVRY